MTCRDWDKAQSQTSYKRCYEALQRALGQVIHENHVHAECLALAIEGLELYTEGSTDGIPAQGVLVEIEARLAELKPGLEEETG